MERNGWGVRVSEDGRKERRKDRRERIKGGGTGQK